MGNKKNDILPNASNSSRRSASLRQRTLFDLFPRKPEPVTSVPEAIDDIPEVLEINSSSPLQPGDVDDIPPVFEIDSSSPPPPGDADEIPPISEINSSSPSQRGGTMSPPVILPTATTTDLVKTDIVNSSHSPCLNSPAKPPNSNVDAIPDDDPVISHTHEPITSSPSGQISSSILLQDEPQVIPGAGSQHHPIIIDSSPVKPPPTRRAEPSYPVHSFFAPRAARAPTVATPEKRLLRRPCSAPYPDKEFQHVKGHQTDFTPSSLDYRLRQVHNPLNPSDEKINLDRDRLKSMPNEENRERFSQNLRLSTLSTTPTSLDEYLETIPMDHRNQHPAIMRLIDSCIDYEVTNPATSLLWGEKWRPRRADEVLGNESSCLYLRDWLRALELQLVNTVGTQPAEQTTVKKKSKGGKSSAAQRGIKRPRIIRSVSKKGGRKKARIDSEEDNWIVNDDYSDNDLFSYGRDEEEFEYTDPSAHVEKNFGELRNTIILVGPPGSGKTACVYACAQELGWEVFEVYPGIGKRSGTSVDLLVGDVGKNHLVQQGSKGLRTAAHISDTLITPVPSDTQYQQHSKENNKPPVNTESPSLLGSESSIIRQSIILLEEVDILFKEDVNFWPAVINFIKECKRPVICTCNDLSLVPSFDLPLQSVLEINPCPPEVAASYFQSLCCAEGYLLERNSLMQLYKNPNHFGGTQEAGSTTVDDCPVPDLRKTIQTLQFVCSASNVSRFGHLLRMEPNTELPEDTRDWTWATNSSDGILGGIEAEDLQDTKANLVALQRIANHAELVSYVDSQLVRNPTTRRMELVFADQKASGDDEVGHTILYDNASRETTQFGLYDHDEEVAATALLFSRGTVTSTSTRGGLSANYNASQTGSLTKDAKEYRTKIGGVLREACPLWVSGSPSRTNLHVDYMPWIRQMVAADDVEELRLQKQARERAGRMTRNSSGRYERMIALTEEARAVLAETVLGDLW